MGWQTLQEDSTITTSVNVQMVSVTYLANSYMMVIAETWLRCTNDQIY